MHFSDEFMIAAMGFGGKLLSFLSVWLVGIEFYFRKRRKLQVVNHAFLSSKAGEMVALVREHEKKLREAKEEMAHLSSRIDTAVLYIQQVKSITGLLEVTNTHLQLVDKHFRKRAQSSSVEELPQNNLRIKEKREK